MIAWNDSIESAARQARDEKKLVLVDFFHPQ